MNEEKKEERIEVRSLKSVYEISIAARDFEINQLIQRNNFFMLFQGVLLASIMQAENSRPFVELVICVTGFLVSIYQIQMAGGAKFWQEWWESRVENFENLLCEELRKDGADPHKLFSVPAAEVKNIVGGRLSSGTSKFLTNPLVLGHFSVGRAPIKVGVVLAVTWIVLLCATLDLSSLFSWIPKIVKGFEVVSIPSR